MANETISSLQTDSMFFGNWVGSSILDEARPHFVVKPLFNREGRRPGLVFNFPIQDNPGAATSNQAEGTSFTNTALSTSSQTATARLNGQVATVTDVLDAVSITDAVGHFAQVMGRSVAHEFEVTATAGFSGSTGAWATVDLAGFYDAMADLEAADATGDFVACVRPAAAATLRTGLTTATTVSYAANAANKTMDLGEAFPNGYIGSVAGVPTYLTSAITAGNNCMFVKGVTFGLYEIWDAKTETHRDIFQPGTQIAATSLYGVATIRSSWGTKG